MLIVGDSRARTLADELVEFADPHDTRPRTTSFEEYPLGWSACDEHAFRYSNNDFCARAPPKSALLCGGALLLHFKACWLYEQECMDMPLSQGAPLPDLVILNAGLHDIVYRPPSAEHRAYVVHRLRLTMRALQRQATHALWLSTQPVCCCKRWTDEFVSPPNGPGAVRQINQAVAAWNAIASQVAAAHGWGVVNTTRLYGRCEWTSDAVHFEFGGPTVGAVLARVISSLVP